MTDAPCEELAMLLDEQQTRLSRKRRRDNIITLVLVLSLIAGAFAWFVHSPDRVAAGKAALQEIRSAGDITAILSNYRAAMDDIGQHASHIEDATKVMNSSKDLDEIDHAQMDGE